MVAIIDVLLFSSRGLLFGVYTEQIEEVLPDEIRAYPGKPPEESTILYRQQKLCVLDFSEYLARKNPQRILTDTEKTALKCRGNSAGEASFSSAKILVIKRQKAEFMGIHVENVIKILPMTLERIRPLPKIMETRKHIPGLWGLTFVNHKLVTLIDLTQLVS